MSSSIPSSLLGHSPQVLASIIGLPPLLSLTCFLAAQRLIGSPKNSDDDKQVNSHKDSNSVITEKSINDNQLNGHAHPQPHSNPYSQARSLLLEMGLQSFPLFAGCSAGILLFLSRSCPGNTLSWLVGVVGALASIPLLVFITMGSLVNMPNIAAVAGSKGSSVTAVNADTDANADSNHVLYRESHKTNGIHRVSFSESLCLEPNGTSDSDDHPNLNTLNSQSLVALETTGNTVIAHTYNHQKANHSASPFSPSAANFNPPEESCALPASRVPPVHSHHRRSYSSGSDSQILNAMPHTDHNDAYLVLGATPHMPALTPGTTVASSTPVGIVTPPHLPPTPVTSEYLALEDDFVRLLIASAARVKQENKDDYPSEIPLAPWPKEWPMYWEGAGLGAW